MGCPSVWSSLAEWIAHWNHMREVWGLNPGWGKFLFIMKGLEFEVQNGTKTENVSLNAKIKN